MKNSFLFDLNVNYILFTGQPTMFLYLKLTFCWKTCFIWRGRLIPPDMRLICDCRPGRCSDGSISVFLNRYFNLTYRQYRVYRQYRRYFFSIFWLRPQYSFSVDVWKTELTKTMINIPLIFCFTFITSAEGGYVFTSVCLSVCLSLGSAEVCTLWTLLVADCYFAISVLVTVQ